MALSIYTPTSSSSSRPPFRYHTLSTRLPFPPASSHSHSSAAHRRRLRLLAIYSCFTCSRSLFQEVRLTSRPPKPATFSLRRPHLAARAAAGNAPTSPVREVVTELDAVAGFSEIVPDTVVFDDFESGALCYREQSQFAPTAATSAIDTALADGECNALEKAEDRMSCYLTKALANVGAELAHQVPGRVSTEIDARLAYDTQGIIHREVAMWRSESGVDDDDGSGE
ncbi:Aldolase superfamily protein [Zea mays]|uniref:Aldolase superfamily protein n=1 Tax=Zea mays TaxID=4577 RepID=A0A1D6PW66_MAIZE|nr:Aldolase superfamily protein [Zea mays]